MNALVTGGGGFLGQYIVEQLVARGDSVRSISRNRYPQLTQLGVEQISGDIQDPMIVHQACQGIDTVFHTAAIAGIWGSWQKYYGVNTLGTRNVLEACRENKVFKLVYCSSPSVIFDASNQEGLDETAAYPTRWLCHYPRSKALAEQEVLSANDSHSFLTCALRPHLIWGPRDQHLIPRLIDSAKKGRLRIVGDGNNLVDNVYVENAAQAHLNASDHLTPGSPVCGQAYFITQGKPVNCWAWINEILTGTGLEPVEKKIGFSSAWSVGWAMETVYRLLGRSAEPSMTRFLAAQLAQHHYYQIDKARRDFGYEPTVSHKLGMARLLDSL
ncbi:MAG: NAD-dependent epimerase/dehydratase family protein [Pirellulaceae bacterium]|nr:NAD-dependent epimerase/dehydratase family protein [Pirellulaceae bacterium]